MRISRTVMAVGGVVLAAAMIGFTNPKTVHALAAALVQVTNTASNPVVTQGTGAQAANMVHLNCEALMDNKSLSPCEMIPANGNDINFNYTVPAGTSLVITAIDLLPSGGCTADDYFATLVGSNPNRLNVATTSSRVTTHFAYPSGLVIVGDGSEVIWEGVTQTGNNNTPSVCGLNIDLFGYLTPA